MSPRATWEEWQAFRARHGVWPTGGAKKPLVEFIHDYAQWTAETLFRDEAKGRQMDPNDVADLQAAFDDLRDLARERGVL